MGDVPGRDDSISSDQTASGSDRGQCRTLARSMATWQMSSLKRTVGAGRTGWPDHHLSGATLGAVRTNNLPELRTDRTKGTGRGAGHELKSTGPETRTGI